MNQKELLEQTTLESLHEYSICVDNREIYLLGEDEVDPSTAAKFIKNLNHLNHISDEPITIYSFSRGGEMTYGLGIFDAIRLSDSPTIHISCGEVASMGTIIAQAANVRLIYPSTCFLIHEGSISLGDTEAKTAISSVQSLKLYVSRLYDIYFSSCKSGPFFKGRSEKFVRGYLKKNLQRKSDWYLLSEEIIKYGLADGILGENNFEHLSEIKDKLSNLVYSNTGELDFTI